MGKTLTIQKQKRVMSIDIIRGIAVALMIIVNNPGSWERNYVQLRHAAWHGVTLADFAFPFFLLSMGVAIPIAINNKLAKNKSTGYILFDIIKRSIILFLFGMFLNYLSNKEITTIRIMGVLQRLSLVYLSTSLIYLYIRKKTENNKTIIGILIAISTLIIVGYYLIAKPFGFEEQGNLAQLVDVHFLNGHLYNEAFDPEGLLTTIVSISTGTLGCIMGCIISKRSKKEYNKFWSILLLGIICLIGSFIFNKYFPFNKRLWSSSFILITAGAYAILLAILYFISDIKNKHKLFTPLTALGSSAIFTYMTLEIIDRTLWLVMISSSKFKEPVPFCSWITYGFITPWAGETYDSLIFSLGYLLIWIVIMMFMYKKKIFIKI